MRILTYNINSVRLRLPLLEAICHELKPDIVCLQETKVQDKDFPKEAIQKLGFPFVHFRGMKSYNGVAILSQHPIKAHQNTPTWCGKEDSRHVAVDVETTSGNITLHNFYIPAGGDEPDVTVNPKFQHKLSFLEEMKSWFESHKPRKTIIVGDFNIAPLPDDVWSHKQLLNTISHTPPETQRLQALLHTGFTDIARYHHPEGKLFSWWSYRNRDWKKSNRGRRLDHIWCSQDIVDNLEDFGIYSHFRDSPKPSDHVPLIADFSFSTRL